MGIPLYKTAHVTEILPEKLRGLTRTRHRNFFASALPDPVEPMAEKNPQQERPGLEGLPIVFMPEPTGASPSQLWLDSPEPVAARLGRLLLGLSHQIGGRTGKVSFRFSLLLTHEEFASMTCTTRETVTRTLSQFRKEGWISIEDSLVTVHQPAQPACCRRSRNPGPAPIPFCRSRCRAHPSPTIIMGVDGFRSSLVSAEPEAVFLD